MNEQNELKGDDGLDITYEEESEMESLPSERKKYDFKNVQKRPKSPKHHGRMNSQGDIVDSDEDFDFDESETANFDIEADQCIEESGESIVPQSIQNILSQSSVFMRPVGASQVPHLQLTKNGVSNYIVRQSLISHKKANIIS